MAIETGSYISDLVATNPTSADPKSQGDDHIRLLKSAIKTTFPNVAGAVTPTHLELNYVAGVTSAIQAQLNAKAPKDTATFTGNTTLPATTVIGSVVSLEITYLSGVTSSIQVQLNAKAPTASPTFTGTVTLPATVNPTDAARKDYVDGVAFAGVLPAQSGNAGRFVTTNGTTASWADAKVANVVTATTATTLTTTPTLLSITPASYGVVVTLPNATTCSVGGPLHKIDNRGAFAVIVKNASGTIVGYVGAGRSEDVSLVNNASSAGVWSIGGQYGLCQLSSATASTSATIDFTGIDGFFDEYEIHLSNVVLSASNLSLTLQVSLNNGSTWQTTGYISANECYTTGSAYAAGASATTLFLNSDAQRIYSNYTGYSGVVQVIRPHISGYITTLMLASYDTAGPAQVASHGMGRIGVVSPVNGFRILPTSGTMLSGSFKLFGKGKGV